MVAEDLVRMVAGAAEVDGAAAVDAWAASGAMALTGERDGPPSAAPARLAVVMSMWADALAEATAQIGERVVVDGAALLGERAALGGLQRNGSTSAGGACRLMPCAGTWVAANLARPDDVDLLPAWLGEPPGAGDPWDVIARSLAVADDADDVIERGAELGLPCARLGETTVAPLTVARGPAWSGAAGRLRVVDLSSLWAGPLCAQLLGASGAQVVKVESVHRPDGARGGPPQLFDLMHGGHRSVALDLHTEAGRRQLLSLVSGADVVVEASRRRALEQLGASYDIAVDHGFRGVWLSITAHGRDGESAMRVGFGDDAAVAGGLVASAAGGPWFCADAVADPATGLLAAAAVATMLAEGTSALVSVTLAGVAAAIAGILGEAPLPRPSAAVAAPRARRPAAVAPAIGEHTDEVLREWAWR